MTETKYILTGDEPHWSGVSVRGFYQDTKFPRIVTLDREDFGSKSVAYRDVDYPSERYQVNAGTPVKEAVGGKVEYTFVGKDGDKTVISPENYICIKPTYVNFEAMQSLFDPVEKPEHYNTNLPEGVEAIDIIAAQVEHLSGLRAVCHANLLKYALRWQKKNGVEDLKKARYYIDRLIKEIENND